MKARLLLFLGILLTGSVLSPLWVIGAEETVTLKGVVRDSETKEGLYFANVLLESDEEHYAVSDEKGAYAFPGIKKGEYRLTVSYIGYDKHTRTIRLAEDSYLVFDLTPSNALREVVVTATESQGITSSSRIDRAAMAHLQPTSFTDLLELLPGGISKDPNMGTVNSIRLRETGYVDANGNSSHNSNYDTSSLGTLFVVDNAPLSTDANLQETPHSSSTDAASTRSVVNRGVDMRSISTDNIESVEIVRGIPSVEYGNLTSGLVKINTIRKANPFTARFKADGYSKLVSAGKGFAVKGKDLVVNVDGGFLSSKADPRNNLENYTRLNFSTRLTWNWETENYHLRWAPNLEYSGTIDDVKQDPDLQYGKIDTYKSSYNTWRQTNTLRLTLPKVAFIDALELNTSVQAQFDKQEQTKLVSPQRFILTPTGTEAGEHDAQLLFSEYIADYLCDGKPFNSFVKLKGNFIFGTPAFKNNVLVGGEWNYTKNFGRGQVYDLSRPLTASGWSSRPRAYKDIPAMQDISFFVQDYVTAQIGSHQLEVQAGVRTISQLGMDSKYELAGKVYFDPRVNIQWSLPGISINDRDLKFTLAGGIGKTTKMPTLAQLYPNLSYRDIIQLAYYDVNNPEEYSRYNVMTYIQDVTNYNLKPARNTKWEVRGDISYGDNRLSVTYFRERMTSGFRSSGGISSYTYKDYDESTIVSSTLQGPPSLEDIPYEEKTVLKTHSYTENGSSLDKQGIEFQFRSQRIKPLRTGVTVNGAWFRSVYKNSVPMYETVSSVINGQAISDIYIGLYDWDDGKEINRLTSKILFDTQIPEWGLIFSTSIDCEWFVRHRTLTKNGVPIGYMSAYDNQFHEYIDASREDIYLQQLIKSQQEAQVVWQRIPFAGFLNLKATKKVGKRMDVSFFANRLFDYAPDYTRNGYITRRNYDCYFGMELNFKL